MANATDFVIEKGILKSYNGKATRITIPAGVTRIGKGAFSSYARRDIVSVTIPEGVTEIGAEAFYALESLAEVTLPATLKTIGKGAFLWCKSLTALPLPDSVTALGENAFAYCDKLAQVHLPKGLTQISDGLFRSCYALEEITIPDSVKTIGAEAFDSCSALSTVHLPQTLESIGDSGFSHCKALRGIQIPENCAIAPGAFTGCPGLVDADGFLILRNRLYVHYLGETGDFSVKIPDHVEAMELHALMGYGRRHLEMNLRCPLWEVRGEATTYGFADSVIQTHGSTISFRDDTGTVVAKVVLAMEEETYPKANGAILSIRQADHAFDFAAYDAFWAKLGKTPNKIRVALVRLQYPYALSEEMQGVYEAFLTKQSLAAGKLLIDEEQAELLAMLAQKQMLSKANLQKLVEYANQAGKTALTALLLNLQNTAATAPKKAAKPKGKAPSLWKKPKAGTHLVGRYLGTETEITFPTEVDGVSIEGIANTAGATPANYRALRRVVIPEGYISIGNRAFAGCENLESITFPASLRSLGSGVFAAGAYEEDVPLEALCPTCKNLRELYLPKEVSLGNEVFGDAAIGILVLEAGSRELPNSTFRKCRIDDLVILGGDCKARGFLFDTWWAENRYFPQRVWINGTFDCQDIRDYPQLIAQVHPLSEFDESIIRDERIRALVTKDKQRPAAAQPVLELTIDN